MNRIYHKVFQTYVHLLIITGISYVASSDFTCAGQYHHCDIQPWDQWTACNTTCGVGIHSRKKPVCCDPNIIVPFNLSVCLQSCYIDTNLYQQSCTETKNCGVCYFGTYDSVRNRCNCFYGYDGACCERVLPVTTTTVTKATTTTAHSTTTTTLTTTTIPLTTTTTKPTITITPSTAKHTTTATMPTTKLTTTTSNPLMTTTKPTTMTKVTATTSPFTITTTMSTKATYLITTVNIPTNTNQNIPGHFITMITSKHTNVVTTYSMSTATAVISTSTREKTTIRSAVGDKDDCANDPCINGHCVDTINDFICECNVFFEGKKCSQMKLWSITFISIAAVVLFLACCCIVRHSKSCCRYVNRYRKQMTQVNPIMNQPKPKPNAKPNFRLK